jgi:hypothetical protein
MAGTRSPGMDRHVHTSPESPAFQVLVVEDDALLRAVAVEYPMRWVALQQVARRLQIPRSSAAAAVRVAVDGGWLIGEGEPPHSVCLTDDGRTLSATSKRAR